MSGFRAHDRGILASEKNWRCVWRIALTYSPITLTKDAPRTKAIELDERIDCHGPRSSRPSVNGHDDLMIEQEALKMDGRIALERAPGV